MGAASALPSTDSRAREGAALAVSLVLHLLVALALLVSPSNSPPIPEDVAISVDLVPPRPPRVPPLPSPPPVPPAPRTIPNLGPGELGKVSDPGQVDKPADVKPSPGAQALSKPRAKPTVTERDLVLRQVVRHWRRPANMAAIADGGVTLAVTVQADGTLGPPYGRDLPWNPEAAVQGYDRMPPGSPQRLVVESLYRALRDCQPLSLPPELRAKAPFDTRLDFRFRDINR